MSGWELAVFLVLVVGSFVGIVGIAWWWRWKKDPKAFRESFKQDSPGSIFRRHR